MSKNVYFRIVFFCLKYCTEYFHFIWKELGKTDEILMIYWSENMGWTKFGVRMWNSQLCMLIFRYGFFLGKLFTLRESRRGAWRLGGLEAWRLGGFERRRGLECRYHNQGLPKMTLRSSKVEPRSLLNGPRGV